MKGKIGVTDMLHVGNVFLEIAGYDLSTVWS